MKMINSIEREINQIRLKIHEETQDLTPEQYTERVRQIGEAAAKKYGFERVANANQNYMDVQDEIFNGQSIDDIFSSAKKNWENR